jgi:signal transduction histidine kinase
MVLKLRLQQVSYACSTIFDNQIANFDACSVLFVQNLTQADESETATANDVHVKNASIYEKRRSTDTDPDLVASIDDRLRTVTRRLVESHSAACRRLAEDLHDGLGQTLCMVRLDVESAAAKQDANKGSDTLNLAAKHVRRAQQELREITKGLYSKDTDVSGLVDSLQALAADFRVTKPDIRLTLNMRGFRRDVPVDLGVAIYRIVQESLNNVARHSSASEASLTLESNKNGVHLTVSDNGVGLPSADAIRPGLGLVTMRERTERLGGHYEVSCPANGGLTVDVRWPREIVVSLR